MRTIFLILLIIASINKGKSQCWEIIYDGGNDNIVFTNLEVLNDSVFWVVAGLVEQGQSLGLRTEDKGDSWSIVTWPSSISHPSSIELIDQNSAFIGAFKYSVFKTEDKGWSWDDVDLPPEGGGTQIRYIVFNNENEGWLTVDKGSIFHTQDGGSNWVEKGNNVELGIPSFRGFQAVTDSVLYFYGWHAFSSANSARIWKTINKGDTWNTLNLGLPTSELDFFFLDQTTGWIPCQNNTIYKTLDGGDTWSEYTVTDNSETYGFTTQFTSNSIGWVGGAILDSPNFYNAFISYSKDGGETWARQHLAIDTSYVLEYENDNRIRELHMVNDTLGYAISSRGRIYRYRGRAAECGPAPVLLGTNVLSPSFSWAAAEGCFDGYYFQIGSSPGEDDLLPPTDV
ncbi:WD40/YVTN/BNR-like repeat-containing protein, partial [Phaeodactylibacter xiamenensis]|uniref:WD40/YVTN/BNR-like repeat-containing protein n=1 Tax=Phaeodactylibacter xiamenensis TaxID=1524460 RepID=UPI0024A7C367